MHSKMPSAKWRSSCLGLNISNYIRYDAMMFQNGEVGHVRVHTAWQVSSTHDDVIKWKHFPRCPFCAGNSPVSGEFPAQRPVTRSFEVFFDLRPNKRLSKQSWGWWFKTLSSPLWRHRNALVKFQTNWLSYWHRSKMAAILQRPFSRNCSCFDSNLTGVSSQGYWHKNHLWFR